MKTLTQTLLMTQLVVGLSLSAAQAEEGKAASVAYRAAKERTTHFDDSATARQFVEAVRKLGCEASIDDHGNHLDVSFRLAEWKSITLKTEKLAHQWEDWLKKNGFETIHAHGEDGDHAGHDHSGLKHREVSSGHSHGDGHNHGTGEVLTYSLTRWQTLHARNQSDEDQLIAVMKGLGCDVRVDEHGGHGDITYRCPRPMHLEMSSHRVAASWEDWLQKKGFRTEHVH